MSHELKEIDIENNFFNVLADIDTIAAKNGRDSAEITLVGVTKKFDFDRIKIAIDAGLKIIGEVVGTELKKKLPLISHYSPSTEIHVISKLQSNKIKFSVEQCDLIQSVHNENILDLINNRAKKLNIIFPVYLQIDVSDILDSKGLTLIQLDSILEKITNYSSITLQGAMTIAPIALESNEKLLRKFFRKTSEVFHKKFLSVVDSSNPQLSMGMSRDYKIAIEEGSTMVRIGTAIFGSRY